MPLEPGTYTITSPALKNWEVVSRHRVEDHSLLPKRVLAIPPSVASSLKWKVECVGEDRYKLSIGGHTAALDDKLYAVLLPEPPAEEWKITYVERAAKGYIITSTSSGKGWVIPSDDNEIPQIEVRTLIVGPSFPPTYPTGEIFTFTKVPDSEE
ncbi:proteinase inhibitor [Phlebopus sp. FC_14]|nr:proteinase inhibitor [Phlebopus sp. FC_14]